MTKTEILAKIQKSEAGLADLLGIERQAVYQWPDDKPIPELRWTQLKYIHFPQLFAGVPDPNYAEIRKQKGEAA